MNIFDGLRHQLKALYRLTAHRLDSPPGAVSLWGGAQSSAGPVIPKLLSLPGQPPPPDPTLPKSPTCFSKMGHAPKTFISFRDIIPSFKVSTYIKGHILCFQELITSNYVCPVLFNQYTLKHE